MAVVASETRNVQALQDGIERWLRAHVAGLADAAVEGLRSFSEGGLANETWEVRMSAPSGEQRYVMRLPPLGPAVFRHQDFAKEARLQNVLAGAGIGAVPASYEADESWLGADFLLMPKVAGRVPPAHPPYTQGGWLNDEPVDYRSRLMDAFTDRLADLHRLDWTDLGLDFVQRSGGIGLRPEIEWWKSYLNWASKEAVAEDAAQVEAGFGWCERHCPGNEPAAAVVWGDPRIGNVVFGEDAAVRALLDWETVTLGPAELDLGWHLAHRRNLADAIGGEGLPEFPGFPSRERQLDRYAERLGRGLFDLDWHEIFGAVRLGICRLAVQSAARRSGRTNLPTTRPLRDWVLRAMA